MATVNATVQADTAQAQPRRSLFGAFVKGFGLGLAAMIGVAVIGYALVTAGLSDSGLFQHINKISQNPELYEGMSKLNFWDGLFGGANMGTRYLFTGGPALTALAVSGGIGGVLGITSELKTRNIEANAAEAALRSVDRVQQPEQVIEPAPAVQQAPAQQPVQQPTQNITVAPAAQQQQPVIVTAPAPQPQNINVTPAAPAPQPEQKLQFITTAPQPAQQPVIITPPAQAQPQPQNITVAPAAPAQQSTENNITVTPPAAAPQQPVPVAPPVPAPQPEQQFITVPAPQAANTNHSEPEQTTFRDRFQKQARAESHVADVLQRRQMNPVNGTPVPGVYNV